MPSITRTVPILLILLLMPRARAEVVRLEGGDRLQGTIESHDDHLTRPIGAGHDPAPIDKIESIDGRTTAYSRPRGARTRRTARRTGSGLRNRTGNETRPPEREGKSTVAEAQLNLRQRVISCSCGRRDNGVQKTSTAPSTDSPVQTGRRTELVQPHPRCGKLPGSTPNGSSLRICSSTGQLVGRLSLHARPACCPSTDHPDLCTSR